MSLAAFIDLNTLDNLSRTCRQIREGLLQHRSVLLGATMHCSNEHLPVDPDETLRYRARAGNWFYMQDAGRPAVFSGKSGQCARDLVSECRRCGTVVCRVSIFSPLVFPGLRFSSKDPQLIRRTPLFLELCHQTTGPHRPA